MYYFVNIFTFQNFFNKLLLIVTPKKKKDLFLVLKWRLTRNYVRLSKLICELFLLVLKPKSGTEVLSENL